MINIVNTITVKGLKAIGTEVQVSIYQGMPAFQIVGMANKSVNEAAIRIRTALNNIGLDLPPKKVVVNLSPTDLIKDGNYYDLPIIIGILHELKIINNLNLDKYLIIGELCLSGTIKNVNIALIAALYSLEKNLNLICPQENGSLALLSGLKNIVAAKDLFSLINHLNGTISCPPPKPPTLQHNHYTEQDFSFVKGNYILKRAMEIAAAGGHSLAMQGPPGCGKTFSAECLRSIMPDLSIEEIIEICMINNTHNTQESIIDENNIINVSRPFRCPHHSASMASIVGGGKEVNPGEITLAHNGILFLDELAEFSPVVLDALRQPMENGYVNIARVQKHVSYPANFQLIAAFNPCKCGYLTDPSRKCHKAPFCAEEYQRKISGPLLDRIDLQVHIEGNNTNNNNEDENSLGDQYKNSATIKQRVNAARMIQNERYKNLGYRVNAKVKIDDNFINLMQIKQEAIDILNHLLENQKISIRGFNKIIKIGRTIADLEEASYITKDHIKEALYFKKR